MIEVLEHGKMKVIKCSECGCIFKCSDKDIDWSHYTNANGERKTVGFIKCPDCDSLEDIHD